MDKFPDSIKTVTWTPEQVADERARISGIILADRAAGLPSSEFKINGGPCTRQKLSAELTSVIDDFRHLCGNKDLNKKEWCMVGLGGVSYTDTFRAEHYK